MDIFKKIYMKLKKHLMKILILGQYIYLGISALIVKYYILSLMLKCTSKTKNSFLNAENKYNLKGF